MDHPGRLSPLSWAQFHACRWGVGAAQWLPEGAWTACRAEYEVEDGEEVVVGLNIGGSRAASAVVAVTRDLRVADVHVFEGDEAVLKTPTRCGTSRSGPAWPRWLSIPGGTRPEALRLERDDGLVMVQFGQSHQRMTIASEGLHAAIVEKRLRHPGDRDLDRHVAAAVARATGRGWRLDKSERTAQIDAVVALAMAVERAQHREPAARLLGWI